MTAFFVRFEDLGIRTQAAATNGAVATDLSRAAMNIFCLKLKFAADVLVLYWFCIGFLYWFCIGSVLFRSVLFWFWIFCRLLWRFCVFLQVTTPFSEWRPRSPVPFRPAAITAAAGTPKRIKMLAGVAHTQTDHTQTDHGGCRHTHTRYGLGLTSFFGAS